MYRTKERIFRILALIVALSLIAGCSPATASQPTTPAAAAQPASGSPTTAAQPVPGSDTAAKSTTSGQPVKEVKVGVLLPISGASAASGQNLKQSTDFAAKWINENGGIKSLGGAKLTLIYGDTQGDPAVGSNEAERLIKNENVSAIMGAFASSVTYPSTEVAERYKVPYLVPNSNMDDITQRGFKYTFRVELKASLWSKSQIDFLTWLNTKFAQEKGITIKKLGLVYEDSDHGQSQAAGWKKYAKEAGYEIVLDQAYSSKAADLTSVAMQIKQAKPDAVLFVSYISDAILMFKTLSEQRANAPVYIGSSAGYSDPSFVKQIGPLADYLFDLTEWTPDLPNPISQEVNTAYKAQYGNNMNGAGAFCYGGTFILADALERAASTDPEKIREALAATNITDGRATIIPWNPLQFDQDGQMKNSAMLVVQYQDGVRHSVWPEKIAAVKPIFPQPTWEERLK
jgi:branched-chain amino acid transport system substrate-binding protein